MNTSLVQAIPQGTLVLYWWISLIAGVVVIIVVALLLTILHRTAEQIRTGVADIWSAGKLIANNTVHIPMLGRTNQLLAGVLDSADGLAQATERIQRAVVRK
jgi:hypothetical protein